jgi:hypothetical protein
MDNSFGLQISMMIALAPREACRRLPVEVASLAIDT